MSFLRRLVAAILTSLSACAACAATTGSADCLFNWAESHYPTLFSPAGQASQQNVPPYYYRYYPGTKDYVGVDNDTQHVVYLSPPPNAQLFDEGTLASWLTTAGCPTTVSEIAFDCTATSSCAQINVNGDAADTSGASAFYGNLDPTVRRDASGNLWFMYSFPFVIAGTSTPTIEIHLATSTDHGVTWNFVNKVYPYSNPADGNYVSHEVSNFAMQNLNGVTTWYAIAHSYEVPPGGSQANPNKALYVEPVFSQSSTYVLVAASDPAHLATPTDSTTLNCGATTSAYASPANANLTTISGDTKAYTWREPAMIVQGDTLYLLIQQADANGNFGYIGVFAAKTTGKMSTWNWRYLGKLFQSGDAAQALPTAQSPNFTEIDVTQRADGQVLVIMTAMDNATSQKYGSRIAPVATLGNYDTLAPPAMVRDGNGKLLLIGQFTASDLNTLPNQGPGASTYEAQEPTLGVLIARRNIQPNVHGFTFNTGQHP